MKTEPLITVASITAAAVAILALAVAFGVPVTDAQQNAILGVVAVAAPVVVALIARRLVTANANVVERTEDRDGEQTVVAGEANDIPTGAAIRPLSEFPEYVAQHAAGYITNESSVAEPVLTKEQLEAASRASQHDPEGE